MEPHQNIERSEVRPDVTQLLLAGTVNFFHIVIVLFNDCSVRDHLQNLADVQDRVQAGASAGQNVVGNQPGAKPHLADAGAAVNGPGEGERLDQVRRYSEQRLALAYGLVDEMELPMLEISDPAVD